MKNQKITELLNKQSYNFDDLVSIMEILRSPDGCPWDREQDHKTIRENFIEETYEVIEAIDTENSALLREELGDVLLQVVFHARISEENGEFKIDNVANDICAKLIHRHPHIFADVNAETSEEVLKNWENIKSDEKQRVTVTDKLRSIPKQFPALMRATKVGKKASCFDFPNEQSVIEKIYEELDEVKAAIGEGNEAHIEEEIGDLLLTVTSLARKLGVSSEAALGKATDKFIDRFEDIENQTIAMGIDIKNTNLAELDAMWEKNKENR